MKRRSFLASGITAVGTATLLPSVTLATASRTPARFWARYLTSLHGPVSPRHVAVFSGSTVAAAAEAQAALRIPTTLRRIVQRSVEEDVAEAPATPVAAPE